MRPKAPARTGGPARGEGGFSAAELIVTLAVVVIVAAAAVPSVLGALANYYRNGAAREVLAAIRSAQSLAVAREGFYVFQSGADAGYSASLYRIVKDTTGSCGLPSAGTAQDGVNVVQGWTDLTIAYPGMTILSVKDASNVSLGKVMFNDRGASVNTCASVSFPIKVTVADSAGTTRQIEIRSAGLIRLN